MCERILLILIKFQSHIQETHDKISSNKNLRGSRATLITVLVISIIIVIIVLVLALVTTSKAYGFKHTIDELDENLITTKKEMNKQKEE